MLVIGIIVVVVWFIVAQRAKARARERFLTKIKGICFSHADALGRRYRQLVKQDAYGRTEYDAWGRESVYFANTQLVPTFEGNEMKLFVALSEEVSKIIWATAMAARDQLIDKATEADIDKMSGLEYEQHCADLLRKAGWDVQVTKGSGDFGIDLIGEKTIGERARRVVFQCKRYSAPIGISAVQEVIAGKQYDSADTAIVVSNQRYTPAAESMAASSGVLLLHHADLLSLDRLLT